MRISVVRLSIAAALVSGLVSLRGPVVAASAPMVLQATQTHETNIAGLVAEVTEAKRQEGVLSIRIRFRNTSDKVIEFDLIKNRDYDQYYVVAASKKYLVLRDTEKVPIAAMVDNAGRVLVKIDKGGTYTWWAKYPAPPADVKKFNYMMAIAPPIENIPIVD